MGKAVEPRTTTLVAADSPLAEIERALGLIVRQANLGRIHDRVCRETGVRLDRARYVILVRVQEHGPIRLSELAQLLNVDVSTASRQVAQLERAGLVRRQTDDRDRRASALTITAEGVRLVRRLRQAWRAGLAEMLSGWKAEDQSSLADLLGRLADEIAIYSAGLPVAPKKTRR